MRPQSGWRATGVVLCFGSAVVVAVLGACDAGDAPRSQGTRHSQQVPPTAPTSPPADLSLLGVSHEGLPVPVGDMVADRQQAGAGVVAIPLSRKGRVTLRVACHGPGGITLSDASTTIIATKGCEAVSPIEAGLPDGWRPARVTVTVEPGTVWRLGAWIEKD